eukprot:4513206-Prymnesium_polylepis.2
MVASAPFEVRAPSAHDEQSPVCVVDRDRERARGIGHGQETCWNARYCWGQSTAQTLSSRRGIFNIRGGAHAHSMRAAIFGHGVGHGVTGYPLSWHGRNTAYRIPLTALQIYRTDATPRDR